MKLRCVETECKTRMFSEGTEYQAFPYNDYVKNLVTVKDDLGHARHIGLYPNSDEQPRFIIGWKQVDFTHHEIPQYAIFEVDG